MARGPINPYNSLAKLAQTVMERATAAEKNSDMAASNPAKYDVAVVFGEAARSYLKAHFNLS